MPDAIVGPTTDRAVEVTGEDRHAYLDDVTSQALRDAAPGTATSALHLDAHGSPLLAFDVAVLEDRILLLVPEPLVDEVHRLLGSRTFLSQASFATTDDTVVRLRGADAHVVAEKAGLDVGPMAARVADDGLVLRGSSHGVDLVGPGDAVEAAIAQLLDAGAQAVDAGALAAWEITAGVPRWGDEITSGRLPEELGLLPTHVHLAKGCYPGQEAVARMWMLGRPRRQLAAVTIEGDVAAGWQAGEGRRRVEVTRVADGRGLAFVPPDAEVGDRFEAESGGAVQVAALVGAGAEVPGHDPAMKRRRDRR